MSILFGLAALAIVSVVVACQQSYIAALRRTIAELDGDAIDLKATLMLTRQRAGLDVTGYRTRVRPVPPEFFP